MDEYVFLWEDETGRKRWQPQLGEYRLWTGGYGGFWEKWRPVRAEPVLYRWRWWARFRAMQEERRNARIFRPVHPSGEEG